MDQSPLSSLSSPATSEIRVRSVAEIARKFDALGTSNNISPESVDDTPLWLMIIIAFVSFWLLYFILFKTQFVWIFFSTPLSEQPSYPYPYDTDKDENNKVSLNLIRDTDTEN
ncbi:hypothetical protein YASMINEVIRUS_669 [Yasminevirus sp. GU-2018]|uniref:Uncharacterized protein n=1 Tax=Yasminevirus sp. GU-2018 TaxID=2420051 RepID=A0A5K0UAT0_9VIRU|nr:hypothetical protein YASMINEVIRUS_669 [Yasminevirus sp. GU-2018]